MTIYIKSKEEGKNKTIRFWVPLFFFKQKWLYRLLLKEYKKRKGEDITAKEEIKKIEDLGASAYRDLKKFIKLNGHFDLVEVDTKNGEKIKIRI